MKSLCAIAISLAITLMTSISASALTVIDNMDNGGAYGARTEMNDIIEGKGAVSQKATGGTIVLQRTIDPPIDISQYRGTGYVRLHLYIESVANMSDTAGQLELTSSGTCDVEETSWNISKNMLKDGWNTLYLSLESPGENAADLSKINYVRVYIHITGENRVMLDELTVGTEDELGVKPANIETSEPVKNPIDVYGEGGAAAAALAAGKASQTEQPAPEAGVEDKSEDAPANETAEPDQADDTLEEVTAIPKKLSASTVAALGAIGGAIIAGAAYFIIKRGKRKKK